ncbi:MAG TPA: PQQ-binding-like beta-propeller repeat protein, partial [Verrucomicrobiae bacterium]|nr:PQQ-binding-like beta-propeller repeat protein [Verrucomicrobiae bacterium]
GSGLLFVGDFSGFLHCLDAETGQLYWTHDMKAHMWGSTLVADGKVYAGDEDGDFLVFAASKEKKVISETHLDAPVYSTPVVANGSIYVGTSSYLYSLFDESKAALIKDQPAKVDIEVKKP